MGRSFLHVLWFGLVCSDFYRLDPKDPFGGLTMREFLPLMQCIGENAQTHEAISLLPLQLEAAGYQPGVFLEIGGYDGISESQTLVLERCFGWQGVLIEASPKNFAKLERSSRIAAKIHAAGCKNGGTIRITDSGKTVDAAVDIVTSEYLSKWGRHMNTSHLVHVPCKELKDVLRDAGHDRVDFMSVDVQGSELHVLQTADPDSLNVVLVEAEGTSPVKNQRVQEMLTGIGLRQLPMPYPSNPKCTGCNDLFARPALRTDIGHEEKLTKKEFDVLESLLATLRPKPV